VREVLLLLMFVCNVGLMFPDVTCREDAGDKLVVAEKQLLGCKRVSANFFLFCILVFELMELFQVQFLLQCSYFSIIHL